MPTTIEIIQEPGNGRLTRYCARVGEHKVVGATAGQALDLLEKVLADKEHRIQGSAVIILQRFDPDSFFGPEKRARLSVLMDRFHEAVDKGKELSEEEQAELEQLIEEELHASAKRAAAMAQLLTAPNSK